MSPPEPAPRRFGPRQAALGLLVAVLAGVAVRSWQRLDEEQAALEVCELQQEGQATAAVSASDALVSELDRAGAGDLVGCRCLALLALNRGAECLALVDEITAIQGPEWARTAQSVTAALFVTLEAGRQDEALAWAKRLAERHPPSAATLTHELMARLDREPPTETTAALLPRVRALPDDATALARRMLADRLARAGEVDRALEVLEPPDQADLESWFMDRARILANAGRQLDLVRNMERWEAMGGRPSSLLLRYAIVLETSGLADKERTWKQLYEAAIRGADPVADKELIETAWERLIGMAVLTGETELARAWYAEARARGAELGLSAEELGRLLAEGAAEGRGALRFEAPDWRPGDVLLVAPPDAAPADSPYERLPLRSARVDLSRPTGDTPTRWVWADAEGRPLGSGSAWPSPAGVAAIPVGERSDAPVLPPPYERRPPPADGRTRVYTIILDCGDWRLIRYLQARGELPTLSALERAGVAGVLTSVPPMTGTAMEKIANPRAESTITFISYLNHLGAEIGGLSSVGRNPLEGLAWALPDAPTLFDVVGEGERVAANMLFSHGAKVDVGRNAETVGPRGLRDQLSGFQWRRKLHEDELALVGADLARSEHLQDIAAELDAAIALARARKLDLLLLRVEPLDLLTHGNYGETTHAGRDDGAQILYQVYRYIDNRLGELASAVDQDDVLIVMSDHGIQASMVHDPEAFFVAVGPGIPVGRLQGQPEIAGVPRLLLDLLGVPVPEGWIDTGLSAMVRPGSPP